MIYLNRIWNGSLVGEVDPILSAKVFYFILDLCDLFSRLGLGKYADVFQDQEVYKLFAISIFYFIFLPMVAPQ